MLGNIMGSTRWWRQLLWVNEAVPPLPHWIVTGNSPAGHMSIILCLAIDFPPAIVQGRYV